MKKTSKKLATLAVLIGILGTSLSACKPYNTPEFVEVSPSQTAFMIPLVGDSTNQAKLASEEALSENLVSTKRITIPKEWVKTGRALFFEKGQWMPTARVILVERKPETREWTETGDGTSAANQGITAESKESIGFMARMNCTASIQESDAVKFLYNYNVKTLAEIMDTEVRAMIESKFNEEVAKYTISEVLVNKEQIMGVVRTFVTESFAKKGITISTLGLKGELTYLNKDIQTSIDAKFQAEKAKEAQAIDNEKNKDKATADSAVIQSQASTLSESIKLKEAEAKVIEAQAKLEQAKAMSSWNVKVLGPNSIISNDILSDDKTK